MYSPRAAREAGEVGRAVAAPRLVHDARAGGGRELGAAVVGVVVGDDDLAGDARLVERRQRAPHALLDVLGLVEARDDDRDLDRRGGGGPRRARLVCFESRPWRCPARGADGPLATSERARSANVARQRSSVAHELARL